MANALSTSQPIGQTFQLALLGSGSITVEVDPTPSGGGVSSFAARVGAVVPTAGDYAGSQVTNDSTVAGATVSAALNTLAAVRPFFASYYVDPTFAGVQTGSMSNPFTTIAAAFAAGAALGLAAGIITLPPGQTVTENVVFPTTGKWELTAPTPSPGFTEPTTLNGTVSVTGNVRHTISNMQIAGAISGDAGATASRLLLRDAAPNAAVNLTATGGGNWLLIFASANNHLVQAAAAVSVTGTIFAAEYSFQGALSFSATSQFLLCNFGPGATFTSNAAGAVIVTFISIATPFVAALTFTAASGSLQVQFDGLSAQRAMAAGVNTVGAVTVVPGNGNGAAQRQTVSANAGAFTASNKFPQSLCVCEGTVTILTPGTLGAIQVNLLYTDINGVAQTKALLTVALNVTSAAGTETPFSFIFSQNGSIAVQWQVVGITTPGALVASVSLAVRVAGP